MSLVHYEIADRVGTITLDSPGNRNALSRQLVTELAEVLQRSRDDESQVLVIRSSERVFCSGADLSEAAEGSMTEGAKALVGLQRGIVDHTKPVVVRLDGPVRAGGLGIVGAADIVICHSAVTFAFTESRLALAPAVISLTVLPRLTSRAAAETFLTGRGFTAAEAREMGLVSTVTDDVDAAVAAAVAELLQAHPQGLLETKALLAGPVLSNIDAHAETMAALSSRLFNSDAAREAMVAFLNRKK